MNTITLMETPSSLTAKSRYSWTEFADGFRLEGRERSSVEVRLAPNQTFLTIFDPREPTLFQETFNVYAYPYLLDLLIDRLMQEWQPPVGKPYWSGAYLWACKHAKQQLQYRIYSQWQRLLELMPEQKRLVAKSVFAATFDYKKHGGEIWDEIYEQPFLVKDITQYRAAAAACHYALLLASYNVGQRGYTEPLDGTQHPFLKLRALEIVSNDWKAFFAYDGKVHTSLRRTLMNIPGGISGAQLCYLSRASRWLNRPITDRVELLNFLIFAELTVEEATAQWLAPVYVKAQRQEILAALALLSTHLRRKLNTRKAGIREHVGYIYDYSRDCVAENVAPHRGNLVGLTEKAIAWHKQFAGRTSTSYRPGFSGTTPTTLPPIALPDTPGITFLARVEDILNEGMHMRHCIASYATAAVGGRCYLFHIDYQDTQASIMVNPKGIVVQAYGPRNTKTAASDYGRKILARWGEGLATSEISFNSRNGNHIPQDNPTHEIDHHPF